MASMIIGILLTGTVIYTSILYKSDSLLFLGYAFGAYFIFACLFLAYRLCTVKCRVTFPIPIAECGKPLAVRIQVGNRSYVPYLKFKCRIEQKNSFVNRKRRKWLRGGMVPYGESSFDFHLIMRDYGSHEISVTKIRVYDLTGLFYLQKKVKSKGTIQIFPKMQEIGIHLTEGTRNFYGDADVYDDYRPGYDNGELFQVRPFQNGDKIQGIHWKLSVKLDELLVKEDSLPKACPVVLLLDYKAGRQKRAEIANAYLTVLASISFSLMDAGCPHYAAWHSSMQGDAVRVRVDDEESLYLFLSCYLQEAFQHNPGGLEEVYKEKYRGENCLFFLQLDGQLNLRKNGDIIAGFGQKGWEKALGGLDIIL